MTKTSPITKTATQIKYATTIERLKLRTAALAEVAPKEPAEEKEPKLSDEANAAKRVLEENDFGCYSKQVAALAAAILGVPAETFTGKKKAQIEFFEPIPNGKIALTVLVPFGKNTASDNYENNVPVVATLFHGSDDSPTAVKPNGSHGNYMRAYVSNVRPATPEEIESLTEEQLQYAQDMLV